MERVEQPGPAERSGHAEHGQSGMDRLRLENKILRAALEKLRDQTRECECRVGSFVANCAHCKKVSKIIEPALRETAQTALCKFRGALVLIEISAKDSGSGGFGKCPECGHDKFREAPAGWTECDNPDGCGCAILTTHLGRATA